MPIFTQASSPAQQKMNDYGPFNWWECFPGSSFRSLAYLP